MGKLIWTRIEDDEGDYWQSNVGGYIVWLAGFLGKDMKPFLVAGLYEGGNRFDLSP